MCVYGCVSIANLIKYLKNALLAILGQRTITHTGSLFTASTWGDCSFFLSLHFYFLLFVFVCLSVHLLVCVCVCVCLSVSLPVYLCVCLSMCLCVCPSFCASVCLYVFLYYVYMYMYVVFIVINVCKLLHIRRPTSAPGLFGILVK